MKSISDIARTACSLVNAKQITAANAGAVMTKLMQISLGWVYADRRRVVELDPAARLKHSSTYALAASHKVLVFVPYRHALAMVSRKRSARLAVTRLLSLAKRLSESDPKSLTLSRTRGQYTDLLAHPAVLRTVSR